MITWIKKNIKTLIVGVVIWILGMLFLVAPLAVSISESTTNSVFNIQTFLGQLPKNVTSFSSITKTFNNETIGIFGKCTLGYTIIIAIAVGIGLYKARSKSEYDKIEHGSSDWSQGGEQYRVLSKNQGLILAENNYLPLNKIGNVNVLIVGGSGSGKSSSYSMPNAYQCLGSYIFTDPKGEIYDSTAGYLKSKGYEIKILNLVNPTCSDSYNPIQHIQSEIDVDIIANTIIKGQKTEATKSSDPYWDNMSELLLKALIYYLLAKRPPEEQNLASCAELVRAASKNGDSNLLSNLMSELPYDHPARMNYKSVELASEKTYGTILSSLQSSLGKFDSKEIADVTSTNTIDFDDIAKKKTALYVVSSDTHAAYDFLLTIFFSQMIQQLYDFADRNGGKLPVPAFFILDEFANIGQVPDFDKKISTSRSRGISFSVILQNLDQLKAIYDKSYETIIGNCDTHVFLGSNSYETVEYFSKELGEKTISHNSKTMNRNNDSVRTGYSESDQIMARALMTPDELRRMDNNECIIFEKGLKPIKAKKFWYYKKPNIVRDFNNNRLNHNDYKVADRGEWRKFNPANPYTEKSEDNKELEIGALDNLFSEIETPTNKQGDTINEIKSQDASTISNTSITKSNSTMQINGINNNNSDIANTIKPSAEPIIKQAQQSSVNINNTTQEQIENVGAIPKETPTNTEQSIVQSQNQFNNLKSVDQTNEEEVDIQKELEAKFDELFGNLND